LDRFILAVQKLEDDVRLKLLIILRLRHDFPLTDQVELMSDGLKDYFNDNVPFEIFATAAPDVTQEMVISPASVEFLQYLLSFDYPEEFRDEIENLKANSIDNPTVSKQDDASVGDAIKLFLTAPDEVKQEIRFRDQFPFLNDLSTPDELKILVAEKFSHYQSFCEAHSELLSRVVLPFVEGKNLKTQNKFKRMKFLL